MGRYHTFIQTVITVVKRLPALLLMGFIRMYQRVVSPYIKPSCRFFPSCSDYALTALHRHGMMKGFWLMGCRLLRCHPWSLGGYDPVSPEKENSTWK